MIPDTLEDTVQQRETIRRHISLADEFYSFPFSHKNKVRLSHPQATGGMAHLARAQHEAPRSIATLPPPTLPSQGYPQHFVAGTHLNTWVKR